MFLPLLLTLKPTLRLELDWKVPGQIASVNVRNISPSPVEVWKAGNSWHWNSFRFEVRVKDKWKALTPETIHWKQNTPVTTVLRPGAAQPNEFPLAEFKGWNAKFDEIRVTYSPSVPPSKKPFYPGLKIVATLAKPTA